MVRSFLFYLSLTTSLISLGDQHQLVATEYQTPTEQRVPLLDLNNFNFGSEIQQADFVSQFGQALHTYGFVLINNHGIEQSVIDTAYKSSRDFFSLPAEIKKQYQSVQANRGYKGYDSNREDKKSDLQEYWHVGAEIYGNIWPLELNNFENDLSSLYSRIQIQSQPLLEATSLYMNLERSFLSNFTQAGDSIMRVIHYLPSEQNKIWKAAHCDPNLLTIIVGATAEGLELEMPNGSWVKVPYHPEAIIVSASNMLESLSNGMIRSAPHRVVMAQSGISRYSIPFFFHGQRNMSIAPLPECVSITGGEPLYPNQTVEEALKDHQWFKEIERR